MHQKDPKALRSKEIYKGAPEWLDDPRKIKPARIKSDVGV
jgi:hypothetical protein